MRGRRLAAGLTQVDLATRAGIGVRTVRDLERGRSSRPQRSTVDLIADALGLGDAERSHFVATGRGQSVAESVGARAGPASGRRLTGHRSNGLPAPVDLIGRDRDVADLAAMLAGAPGPSPRLVSLVGMAGVGKTGLALAVADRVAGQHPGGVAGIQVTDVSTENGLLAATAAVFGVARAPDLAGRLADAPALLVVDAVERAPDAVAAALHRLGHTAPALRIVTTGRHPVGLPGERVWPVGPLDVPPAETHADLGTVAQYPAAALFLARLSQVRRDPLEPDEVPALVGLVHRLGGLPLALELAAARGRILDLNQILNRYGDRVLDLTGPPVTGEAAVVTLRDAVGASYRLLERAERVALRRLSVFRNRWSVELAEAILADEPERSMKIDSVALLDRLLALGLVNARGSGPYRFRLLDVVRDFAIEQAAAKGELPAIRRRHGVLFARLAGRVAPDLAGVNLTDAVARLDAVASDLWAALAYSANDDPYTALELAAALPRWWRFRGRDGAGRQWLRRLLDDPRTADADPTVRAWAQVGVAQLAAEHGAGQQELPAAESALARFQALGDVTGELAARSVLCALWMGNGGYDEARRHGAAMLSLATRTGRARDMVVAQNNLTWHEVRVGDLDTARRRLAAVDHLAVECGDHRLRVLARANLAEVARLDGRYADAVTLGRRVLPAVVELGDPGHRRRLLCTIGLALARGGRLDEAGAVLTELRGESTAVSREDGVCAVIEATIALQRGDREVAAQWFSVAAQQYAGNRDLRDVAEALVGLVASTDDRDARAAVLDWLVQVCREGGITLLPRERALIKAAAVRVPRQLRDADVVRRRNDGSDDRHRLA